MNKLVSKKVTWKEDIYEDKLSELTLKQILVGGLSVLGLFCVVYLILTTA